MPRIRRILALLAVLLILSLYVLSIVFALMDSPAAQSLLLAALFTTVVVPAVLYGYMVYLKNRRRN